MTACKVRWNGEQESRAKHPQEASYWGHPEEQEGQVNTIQRQMRLGQSSPKRPVTGEASRSKEGRPTPSSASWR